ncbi:MAG: peptidoglycan-binding protein [Candidatus Omnitrophica bacterium]|nr:peptidoglycan-binding protein [Candidatus Omnitrophota bacterium]
MSRSVLFVALAGVVGLSGCAAQRTAQEMNQLKSDIGLLDQRVNQLERASLRQTTGAWSGDPAAPTAVGGPATRPAAPAAPKPAPSVKPAKTEIQQALKNAGFYQGSLDGKIGPQTREAIRQFQQVNGLKTDGIVGRQTWEKLSLYLDQAPVSGELSAAEPLK